jgi:pimeloyl-ACP methyl ester carboxylesterase
MSLLLLHGAGGSRAQLDPLAKLVALRRPVHQVELEGHGATPARGRPATIDVYVENVVAALDSRGLQKIDVFGYELGGAVALALALAHPQRVSTITTLGTRFGGADAPVAAGLARIHHRVRIMVGDRDDTVSVEESAAAFRQLPSGELMVLPRTPHPIEQVDVYRLADVLIELTS